MRARGRVLLGAVVLAAGCTTPVPAVLPAATPATGCASPVETGALPDWADEGFSDVSAKIPHVLGAGGEIVAVLFAHPLTWERTDGANNKILWVSRPAPTPSAPTGVADLLITATLDGTDTRVTREVRGGPGPSIIDLPHAGCWHLDLRWSGRTDTVDLVYADGRAASRGG
ncbi:hypothetical protein ABZ671_07910 [Micromonospora sp. NPDC006766]|uniref:hypothetical protein n=1 Tax=Micromonospora sp. NPDC006766 TaxID=3154778 RepID=UPI0033FD6DF4